MFDMIFKTFFTKTNKVKCITIIKDRQISNEFSAPIRRKIELDNKTCLSKYFENRKGLNMQERLNEYLVKIGNLQ